MSVWGVAELTREQVEQSLPNDQSVAYIHIERPESALNHGFLAYRIDEDVRWHEVTASKGEPSAAAAQSAPSALSLLASLGKVLIVDGSGQISPPATGGAKVLGRTDPTGLLGYSNEKTVGWPGSPAVRPEAGDAGRAIGAVEGGGDGAGSGALGLSGVALRYWEWYRDAMVGTPGLALSGEQVGGLVAELSRWAVGGVVEYVGEVFSHWEVGHGLEVVEAGLAALPPGVEVDRTRLRWFVNDALVAVALRPRLEPLVAGGEAGELALLSPAGLVALLGRVGAAVHGGGDPFVVDEVLAGIRYDWSRRWPQRLVQLGLLNLAPAVVAGLVADGGVWGQLLDGDDALLGAALRVPRVVAARAGAWSAISAVVAARVPTLAGMVAVGRALADRVQAWLDGAGGGAAVLGRVAGWAGRLDRARRELARIELELTELVQRYRTGGVTEPGSGALTRLTTALLGVMDELASVIDEVGGPAGEAAGSSGAGWAVVAGEVVPAVGRRGWWRWSVSRPVRGWGYGVAVGGLLGLPVLAEPTDVRALLGDAVGLGWLWQTIWDEGEVLVSAGTRLLYVQARLDGGRRRVFSIYRAGAGTRQVGLAEIGFYLRARGVTHAHLPARAGRVRWPAAAVTLRAIVFRYRRGEFGAELTTADTAVLIDRLLATESTDSDRAIVRLLRLLDRDVLTELHRDHRRLWGRVKERMGVDHPAHGQLDAFYRTRTEHGPGGEMVFTGQPRRAFDPSRILELLSYSGPGWDAEINRVLKWPGRPRAMMHRLLSAHQVRGVRNVEPSTTELDRSQAGAFGQGLLPVVGDRLDRALDHMNAALAADHDNLAELNEVTLTPPAALKPRLLAALAPSYPPAAAAGPQNPTPEFVEGGFADDLEAALKAAMTRLHTTFVEGKSEKFDMNQIVDIFHVGAEMIKDVFPFLHPPRPVTDPTKTLGENEFYLLDGHEYWGKEFAFESEPPERRAGLRREQARSLLWLYLYMEVEIAPVYREHFARPTFGEQPNRAGRIVRDVIESMVSDEREVDRILTNWQYGSVSARSVENEVQISIFKNGIEWIDRLLLVDMLFSAIHETFHLLPSGRFNDKVGSFDHSAHEYNAGKEGVTSIYHRMVWHHAIRRMKDKRVRKRVEGDLAGKLAPLTDEEMRRMATDYESIREARKLFELAGGLENGLAGVFSHDVDKLFGPSGPPATRGARATDRTNPKGVLGASVEKTVGSSGSPPASVGNRDTEPGRAGDGGDSSAEPGGPGAPSGSVCRRRR